MHFILLLFQSYLEKKKKKRIRNSFKVNFCLLLPKLIMKNKRKKGHKGKSF